MRRPTAARFHPISWPIFRSYRARLRAYALRRGHLSASFVALTRLLLGLSFIYHPTPRLRHYVACLGLLVLRPAGGLGLWIPLAYGSPPTHKLVSLRVFRDVQFAICELKVSGLRRCWNKRKLTTMNGLYDTPAKEDSSKCTDFEYTMAIFPYDFRKRSGPVLRRLQRTPCALGRWHIAHSALLRRSSKSKCGHSPRPWLHPWR